MVSKKDWYMSGEVSGKQRPVNSLIDERMDFQQQSTKLILEEVGSREY